MVCFLQGLRTLEYCLNRAGEHPEQPLTVWSSFLAQEVQVRSTSKGEGYMGS